VSKFKRALFTARHPQHSAVVRLPSGYVRYPTDATVAAASLGRIDYGSVPDAVRTGGFVKIARYIFALLVVFLIVRAMNRVRVGEAGKRAPSPVLDAARVGHREAPDQAPVDSSSLREQRRVGVVAGAAPTQWTRGPYVSVQVNVDHAGVNIVGDAANEPSIAVDPADPRNYVIGWRQFDSVQSNFRQGGWAYSHDAGHSWNFPGVLRRGEFSSDPVVRADADGVFHYLSLQPDRGPGAWACYLYSSYDTGETWTRDRYAFGGDKAWMEIDSGGGIGRGNIYMGWTSGDQSCCGAADFTRSTDGGGSLSTPIDPGITARWGTMDVGPDGALYGVGAETLSVFFGRSVSAQDAGVTPVFEFTRLVVLGGVVTFGTGPNPEGLLGQVWVATDHSGGPTQGNIYILASVDPPGDDPLDVMLVRSVDNGVSWSVPVRVNDDAPAAGSWQWFGTLSVAPNGRIDVVFNDTRNAGAGFVSELFYASSIDGGQTFSANIPVSPPFDPTIGYPQQRKIGDYYDMVSDEFGVSVAYAATFNGEQDVYFLRIGPTDCNANGVPDDADIAAGASADCQPNGVPDECEADCNDNGVADGCDISSGTSLDCSGNRIPDECEPDCNGSGIEDLCDILSGGSADCDGNRIPDECEPDCDGDGLTDACDDAEDSDGDGLRDCDEACADIAPPVPCVCPSVGECCIAPGFCLDNYDRAECLASGWTPTCQEAACCNGCLFGDADRDGDLDLRDAQQLQSCFSGSATDFGFPSPDPACLDQFDADCDGDVDLDDYARIQPVTGP